MSMTGMFESTVSSKLKEARTSLGLAEKSRDSLKNRGSYYEEHVRLIEVLKNVISVYENALNSIDYTYGTPVVHGVNCQKVIHVGEGYLHGDDDNKPYDVDGCSYCGRCHRAL